LDVSADVAVREAGAYEAPAGSFGDITLADDATVIGTGVEDVSVGLRLGYDLTPRYRVYGSFDRYEAQNSGFGAVAPAAYAPDQPSIDIRYPDQRFARATIGLAGTDLRTPIADRVEATGYVQDNERTLTFGLFQSFGPQAPPGAGITIDQWNFTDLHTLGFRIEAKKLASEALLFTYGIDFTRDGAEGSDSSVTTISGFGPPQQEVSTRPQIPNAFFRSLGAFAQGEVTVGRATVVVGGRVQGYHAETEPTAGLDIEPASKTNRTVVGSANAVYALSDHISLIGTVGRAFRSPNLIEYFFDGPTPEGNGYQIRSPDLQPETSLNVDLGARYRDRRLAFEAFVFRNSVRDGIRIEATGTEIDGLPAFRNVNVDELLYRGVELNGELLLPRGFSIGGGFTAIESDNERDPEIPIGETYSSKLTGALRYRHPGGRFWVEYAVRHNGEQKDVVLDENPIGDVLPAFTVHSARAGVTLLRSGPFSHRLGLTVHNLTDTLYAESSNASFFRPEPGRSVIITYDVSF
ncbi:MAG: TonB-dependent receptor, partial [Longimicrobiales bacterium]